VAWLALVVTGCGGGGNSSLVVSQGACAPTLGNPTGTAASLLSVLQKAKSTYGLNAIVFDWTIGSTPMLRTAIGNSTTGVPASTEMHFRVGMAGEQLDATLALLLVDQEQLSLGDFVSKWFPTYPFANLATVRMVGDSSSGFGDYVYGPADPSKGIPSFGDLIDSNPFQEFTASV